MTLHHIFFDRNNIFGAVVSAGSGTTSLLLSDGGQRTILFVISVVVGVLTAVHLLLQIYKVGKSIWKDKYK